MQLEHQSGRRVTMFLAPGLTGQVNPASSGQELERAANVILAARVIILAQDDDQIR
jgi:hypothetical protein